MLLQFKWQSYAKVKVKDGERLQNGSLIEVLYPTGQEPKTEVFL